MKVRCLGGAAKRHSHDIDCNVDSVTIVNGLDAVEELFSDEADGPLDPERKRMFMTMKREVLRIGGYRQEFFVSQTPELAAMADVVIDLEKFRCPQRDRACLSM